MFIMQCLMLKKIIFCKLIWLIPTLWKIHSHCEFGLLGNPGFGLWQFTYNDFSLWCFFPDIFFISVPHQVMIMHFFKNIVFSSFHTHAWRTFATHYIFLYRSDIPVYVHLHVIMDLYFPQFLFPCQTLRTIYKKYVASIILREIRAPVLEQSLRKLGVEKLSIDDVQKMQWEVLEAKIGSWIHFMRIAVRIDIEFIHQMCCLVFSTIWLCLKHRSNCYLQRNGESVIKFLKALILSRTSVLLRQLQTLWQCSLVLARLFQTARGHPRNCLFF